MFTLFFFFLFFFVCLLKSETGVAGVFDPVGCDREGFLRRGAEGAQALRQEARSVAARGRQHAGEPSA